MGKYRWHGTVWSNTGCPGEYHNPGWWTADEKTLIVADYKNPATGKPYTETELDKIHGVVVPPIVIPVKPAANATSTWILGVIIVIIAVGVVWFVVK